MTTSSLSEALDKSMQFALENSYLVALEAATPKKTRKTSASWKLVRKGPGKYTFENTAETRDGKYSIVLLLEEGTKPHRIRAKKAKALHWQIKGKNFFAKEVMHPGFEGRQFVKRVMNDPTTAERYKRLLAISLKQELAKSFS